MDDINNYFRCWFGRDIEEEKLILLKDHLLTQAELGKLFLDNYKQPDLIVEKLVELSC